MMRKFNVFLKNLALTLPGKVVGYYYNLFKNKYRHPITYYGYPVRFELRPEEVRGLSRAAIRRLVERKALSSLHGRLVFKDGKPYVKTDFLWGTVPLPLNEQKLIGTRRNVRLLAENVASAVETTRFAERNNPVTLFIHNPKIFEGSGNFVKTSLLTGKPVIYGSNISPLGMMHEFSHLPDLDTPARKVLARLGFAVNAAANVGIPLTILLGPEIAKRTETKLDDKIVRFVNKWGPELYVASRIINPIIPEYLATKRTNEAIKNWKFSSPMLRKYYIEPMGGDFREFKKDLLMGSNLGFGGYLLNTVIGYGMLSYLRNKYVPEINKDMEKEAAVYIPFYGNLRAALKRAKKLVHTIGAASRAFAKDPKFFLSDMGITKQKLKEWLLKPPMITQYQGVVWGSGASLIGAYTLRHLLDEFEKSQSDSKDYLKQFPALQQTLQTRKHPVKESVSTLINNLIKMSIDYQLMQGV